MIIGTEYYRRKARLSLRALSKHTGIAEPLLQKLKKYLRKMKGGGAA